MNENDFQTLEALTQSMPGLVSPEPLADESVVDSVIEPPSSDPPSLHEDTSTGESAVNADEFDFNEDDLETEAD